MSSVTIVIAAPFTDTHPQDLTLTVDLLCSLKNCNGRIAGL